MMERKKGMWSKKGREVRLSTTKEKDLKLRTEKKEERIGG